jgi:hypothetical protein
MYTVSLNALPIVVTPDTVKLFNDDIPDTVKLVVVSILVEGLYAKALLVLTVDNPEVVSTNGRYLVRFVESDETAIEDAAPLILPTIVLTYKLSHLLLELPKLCDPVVGVIPVPTALLMYTISLNALPIVVTPDTVKLFREDIPDTAKLLAASILVEGLYDSDELVLTVDNPAVTSTNGRYLVRLDESDETAIEDA